MAKPDGDRLTFRRVLQTLSKSGHGNLHVLGMDEIESRNTDRLFGFIAEVMDDRSALVNDGAAFVEQRQHIRRLFDECSEAVFRIAQRPLRFAQADGFRRFPACGKASFRRAGQTHRLGLNAHWEGAPAWSWKWDCYSGARNTVPQIGQY